MSANTFSTKVKRLDDTSVELTRQTLDELQARLQGDLITPGEPGYDESRTIWNGMIDRSPGLVSRCLGAADVVASVHFAREHNLLLSVRGGGHNISGLALCDGGMTIDMSGMRGVWVDSNAESARVQGGCILGDVDRETQL
ncbi:MAG: FAD-dependent oxidoreductase, partial [candidate division Zixibacteria bacterium]|nr:FAD-dependent oxidoreductase [candidate division Zixibacteria bacterium]